MLLLAGVFLFLAGAAFLRGEGRKPAAERNQFVFVLSLLACYMGLALALYVSPQRKPFVTNKNLPRNMPHLKNT